MSELGGPMCLIMWQEYLLAGMGGTASPYTLKMDLPDVFWMARNLIWIPEWLSWDSSIGRAVMMPSLFSKFWSQRKLPSILIDLMLMRSLKAGLRDWSPLF